MKSDYGWICNYENVNPVLGTTTYCCEKGDTLFDTSGDAAAAGLRCHGSAHKNDITVFSYSKGTVGTAIGINFNTIKS